ncbi:hypothetical protein [Halorhabdus salina]|uniref:hypothetical protein n=1 Tax=Halorhabdus salina TaxID=2750670 RepID=UPI0015EE3B9B|nr:hypothetical protein [Halorhabdus salina]
MTHESTDERLETLESLVERQQHRIEEQTATIQDQRDRLEAVLEEDLDAEDGPLHTNRRTILKAGGILGLLGLSAGTASADAQGSVGTSSDPLNSLYTEELNGGVTGGTSLTDIAGSGLSINNNSLEASGGGSTSELVTSGNTAFQVVDGTTDVSSASPGIDAPNVVGGHPSNNTGSSQSEGVTISGGGSDSLPNKISGNSSNFAFIGGGRANEASARLATVGGGDGNTATNFATVAGGASNDATTSYATVAGGNSNTSSGEKAAIGGGDDNEADGLSATVGGGAKNVANGEKATVPGGKLNKALGSHSLAAGRRGYTDKAGAFVWGDSSQTTISADTADQVLFQATGGFVIAPESDQPNMLEVQDQAGNSLLGADTTNHKVQVFDGDASDSVDISHDGTDGDLSTTTGDLVLSPSGNVDLDGNNLETSNGGITVTTNDNGNLTLNPGSTSNNVVLKNIASQDDSILTIDSSGNVGKGSKSISDIGGGTSSYLATAGNGDTAFQVVDGGIDISNPGSSTTAPNVVGGHPNNNTGSSQSEGVFIGGGGADGSNNTVSNNFATIGGGEGNEASGLESTIGGGEGNTASGGQSTIAGGRGNTAGGGQSTTAGGWGNTASGTNSSVGGGIGNTASGAQSTVPGGDNNTANGDGSLAAGSFAKANTYNGAFVWGDSSSTDVLAQATNEVRFQATGGFVIAPESNQTNMLEVQDKDGNAVVNVDTSNGKLDLNGNNVNNIGGTTTPDSAIGLANGTKIEWQAQAAPAKGGIELNTDDEMILATPSTTDPIIQQAAADAAGLSAADLSGAQVMMVTDSDNTEVKMYARDSANNSGTVTVGSYSTERLKSNVQSFSGDSTAVLDVEAKTFTKGNGDGGDRLGITAESAHDAGLEWLVSYESLEDAWQTSDGIDQDYLDEYAIERDGETVVPDNIHDRAWLAMHQELLRDLVEDRDACTEEIADLEADLDAKDSRIEDQRDRINHLESKVENRDNQIDALESELDEKDDRIDELESRLETLEAHVGMDGADAGVSADD